MTVLSNQMPRIATNDGGINSNSPLILSAQDYYPFGMLMPERSYSSGDYRFGFNGMEKDDELKGNGNSLDFGARMYDPRIGRWLSIDPLFKYYPAVSTYAYCLNNSIVFIDSDGREVFIHGVDASKSVAALQTKTSLKLKYDAKTGQLTAMGKPKSKLDIELLKAIEDKEVRVNLYSTKDNSFKSKDGSTQPITIGGYDGSEKKTETVDGREKEIVETTQYINMEQSEKAEKAGVSNQGSDVFHEAIESYYGGQNDPGGTYDPTKWQEAHDKAHAADPTAPELNRNLNSKTGQAGLIDPKTGKSVDLRPMTNEEATAAEKNKP